MAALYPEPDLWAPGYDRFGNLCWQHKHTKQLHYFALPPGQPPAWSPGGYAGGVLQPAIPINLPLNSGGMFNPPECDKKVPKATSGKDSAGPGLKDIRPPPPFPPTICKRPPSPPKSSANKGEQWILQRNKNGEEYYLNTKTLAWQLETPGCLKKYTAI